MKTLVITSVIAMMAPAAFAQTSDPLPPSNPPAEVANDLGTPVGHELSAGLASYNYREPGTHDISIHGTRLVTDYTGSLAINKRRQWFVQAQLRSTLGNVSYTGWCSPFLITPDSASPNGYALDVGDASPCTESGDKDWYVEARGLAGKDFIGRRWGWSPYTGLGLRHLSNGITGTPGYRTDDYLYLPVGVTTRTRAGSDGAWSFNVEFDALLHGWQKTRDSALGGGDVPATPIAPPFTIEGLSDVSFTQPGGWALRAGSKIPMTRHWSVEPYYVRWDVRASPVNYETATFTVNDVTAREQLGAYEPHNTTNEFGVRVGIHF